MAIFRPFLNISYINHSQNPKNLAKNGPKWPFFAIFSHFCHFWSFFAIFLKIFQKKVKKVPKNGQKMAKKWAKNAIFYKKWGFLPKSRFKKVCILIFGHFLTINYSGNFAKKCKKSQFTCSCTSF